MDFDAFSSVIDALGGVDMELSDKEYDQVRWYSSTPSETATPGVYHLNGEQGLYFSRIRAIGDDFARTGRQRRMITALMGKAKSMSFGTMNSVLNELLPKIYTNIQQNEIVDYLLKVPSYLKYEMNDTYFPSKDIAGKKFPGVGQAVVMNDPKTTVLELHHYIYG